MHHEFIVEPACTLAEIASILDSLRLPYFLVGSFASGMRGEFRATNDIDIVCKLDKNSVEQLICKAQNSFYCDEISIPQLVSESRSFNIIHKLTFVKVDIFTKLNELELDEFSRATKCKIPNMDIEINVSTTEYNILAKLRWYRMSGDQLQRQLQDVKSMLQINSDILDHEYLTRWSKVLGVFDLLMDISSTPNTLL